MQRFKRYLAMLLVMCLMIGLLPMDAAATGTESSEVSQTADTSAEFMRIFNLDCGRIYFSVDQIKGVIDELAKNDYTHLALAFGNSGFRFLLDDMAVTVGETTYTSENVKNAILEGNTNYAANDGHNGSSAANTCLTQTEMDAIISYANSKGVSIVPVLNSPGHMNTIVYAMEQLGISNAGYPVSDSYNSESTININNETVTGFVKALIQKYITYFDGKGCTHFNLGADEFANDPTDDSQLGFTSAMKDSFISYVNSVATMISGAGMTPMMFNDGYAWSDANFNKDIVVCYWTTGAVSSTAIANAGHKIINTNQNWYYVLGEPFGTESSSWCSYAKAYNGVQNVSVTSMVDGGNVGENLIGSMMCLWCDYTDETYTAEEVTKAYTLIGTLAENNPDYFTVQETRTIDVTVGQTATDTISGYVYSDVTVADSSIATASAAITDIEGEKEPVPITSLDEIVSGGQYLIAEKDGTTLTANGGNYNNNYNLLALEGTVSVDNENLWTITANSDGTYSIAAGDEYLTFDTNSASVGSDAAAITLEYSNNYWQIQANGDYLNDFGNAGQAAGGWSEYDQNANWLIYKIADTTSIGTEVTFTGAAIGTTTVTVGHVIYTVNVVAEDLSQKSLEYHPWISTYSVHAEGTGSANCNNPGIVNPLTISATTEGVHSMEGVAMTSLVWETGDWRWEEDAQTYYWKSTVLPEGSHQNNNHQTDKSMSGTDFTYIRYWDGAWSYSSDRVTWTEIKDTDEVCAYYLQETEVTVEVDTYVKDWAFTSDNAAGKDENKYQKALSFAVVYPDGTMNPSENNIYENSTLIYWDNLASLGFIRIGVNDVYEVEKITYTMGERDTTNITNTNWTNSETINWEKTTIEDVTWYDETVCWDESYGTEPVINGDDLDDKIYAGTPTAGDTGYDGTWGANDAVLILIYLKPVVTEDSLTVVYIDEKFNDTLYEYNINVDSGNNFNDNIINLESGNVEDPGAFAGNAERIDVSGYGIVNVKDVTETFQTDLTKVPQAIGKYNSGLYTYTGSEISNDGKTLYLYYNINQEALSPNYVIDFGLPITFPLSDVVKSGEDTIQSVTVNEKTRYGTLAYDADKKIFTYTPTDILQNIDVLTINILFDGNSSAITTNVGVTPATTVHYEESFLTWDSGWSDGDEDITVGNQATEVLGKKTYNYGYDSAYASTTGASNGTNATTSTVGAKGTFTFNGDGVQVFANCTEETGYVTVEVKNSSGKVVNVSMVDTVVDEGTTGATTGQTGNLYGLPVVSLVDLQNMVHDTYTVTITKIMDTAPVYIDGIRVFGTIEEDITTDADGNVINNSIYKGDLEDNPDFYELRDMVLHAIGVGADTSVDYKTMYEQVYNATEGEVALITDESVTYGNSSTIQDLLDNGPKNEIYLYAGQTLTFKVSTNRVMQVGMKAPQGATTASVSVDGSETTQAVSSSVDMFYTLANKAESETTYTVQITNAGDKILSITELKICDDPNATFEPLTEEDIEIILNNAGYVEEPETSVIETVISALKNIFSKLFGWS